MIGVGVNPLCISYERISSVASIPPINGMDTSIYKIVRFRFHLLEGMAHKNDVEWLPLCNSTLESINGQASILRNLNSMAIFFEYLHGQFLVDQVVLSQENVESNIIGSRNGADGVRFQC